MPGIAGIIQTHPDPHQADRLQRMLQCLHPAAASQAGELRVERVGLDAGWAGKTGLVPGPSAAWNHDRTVCLILNGEEFSTGGNFDGATLVRRYEELGEPFFLELNGWFSGLLIDLRRDTVTLFNDRYGLARIYCHEAADGFYFASEAKSLLAALPELRRIDLPGLAEFFSVGCVLQNRTLFRDLRLLPGGSLWTFHRGGRLEKRRYFNPETWEQQERLTPAAYGERLRTVFGRIAPRYLAGGNVAMSLTGGLDSRMILAWAKAAPGALPCYTFGGPYRDCADVRIARELARACEQPHTTIRIGSDFFQNFPALAEQTVFLTDGAMDVSGAVELYVNQRAREIAPIRLTGNYGSEILRSNVAFRPRPWDRSLFTDDFFRLIEQAGETYRAEAAGHRLSFIAFKQVPWHHYSRLAIEQSQLTLRSPFLDNELVALAYQAPAELATSPQPLLQLIADGNPALDRVNTDRSLRRHSVPVFSRLERAWQEFTAKAEYAYDYGMPERLVRIDNALKALHLEKLFLGRHKFYHFRIWYREALAAHVRSLGQAAGSLSACCRTGAVQGIVDAHLSGRGNHTLELHKLLSAQLIDRHLAPLS